MSFINESDAGRAGLGFISNIATTAFNRIMQKDLIDDERKWQKEMFNLENAYNSPVAMAQRLRHAGLNAYAMTGQQVAGSFNSGNYPSPAPMDDPFGNIVMAAHIANINADTQKKQNDAEISFQEARKKAVEADNWDEYWSITLENLESEGKLTNAQIETEKAKAQKEFALARKATEDADQFEEFGDNGGNIYSDASNLSKSQTRLNDANKETVDALRSYQVQVQQATADSLRSSAQLAREQCEKTKSETHALSDADAKREWDIQIGNFFGIQDISILAPELQVKAAEYYWDFINGDKEYESTLDAFYAHVNRYIEKNGHIVTATSKSRGASGGFKFGPISGNFSNNSSGSHSR